MLSVAKLATVYLTFRKSPALQLQQQQSLVYLPPLVAIFTLVARRRRRILGDFFPLSTCLSTAVPPSSFCVQSSFLKVVGFLRHSYLCRIAAKHAHCMHKTHTHTYIYACECAMPPHTNKPRGL